MSYSLMEPVPFKKLHNIKLSHSVFFQFDSSKSTLGILLQYTHDFNENMKTLYLKLVTNNNYDKKLYDAR